MSFSLYVLKKMEVKNTKSYNFMKDILFILLKLKFDVVYPHCIPLQENKHFATLLLRHFKYNRHNVNFLRYL
jgi:hypothetical protein